MDKNQIRPLKREEDFDIKKILNRFLVQWKLYLISLIIAALLAFLFIRYSIPLYKIHAQVLIEDNDSKGGSSSSSSFSQTNMLEDFSGMFDLQSNVYNEMAILKTRDLLENTINNLHLNVGYYKRGDIRNIEMFINKSPFKVDFIPVSDSILLTEFGISFPDNGKSSKFTIASLDDTFKVTANFNDTIQSPVGKICVMRTGVPFGNANYSFTINSVAAVLADIQKNMVISIPDDQTTVIQVDYNTNVPKKGEAVVGQLISEYMQRNLNEKNEISDSTIAFINSRIGLVSGDLSGIETDIEH